MKSEKIINLFGAKARTAKELKQSTIFFLKFLLMCLVMTYGIYKLGRDGSIKMLLHATLNNELCIAIFALTGLGIALLAKIFLETKKEANIIEEMVANLDQIGITQAQLPNKCEYGRSLLVNHFRKFATSRNLNWSEQAKSNLEEYLQEAYFRELDRVNFIVLILPFLGFLGTLVGISEVAMAKTSGASMFIGIGNAIGTTVFAIIGKMILLGLVFIVFGERNSQLKTFLVVLRVAEKKEATNEIEK